MAISKSYPTTALAAFLALWAVVSSEGRWDKRDASDRPKATASIPREPRICHRMPDGTQTAPKAGARMADGTIYAGLSPYTGEAMYATPRDAPLTRNFNGTGAQPGWDGNEAFDYAAGLNVRQFLGHSDWRVPKLAELQLLYENRNEGKLKGT